MSNKSSSRDDRKYGSSLHLIADQSFAPKSKQLVSSISFSVIVLGGGFNFEDGSWSGFRKGSAPRPPATDRAQARARARPVKVLWYRACRMRHGTTFVTIAADGYHEDPVPGWSNRWDPASTGTNRVMLHQRSPLALYRRAVHVKTLISDIKTSRSTNESERKKELILACLPKRDGGTGGYQDLLLVSRFSPSMDDGSCSSKHPNSLSKKGTIGSEGRVRRSNVSKRARNPSRTLLDETTAASGVPVRFCIAGDDPLVFIASWRTVLLTTVPRHMGPLISIVVSWIHGCMLCDLLWSLV
nr:hypothetical protein CFP56_62438 [Quercus suber]